jgi:hypothetical protein
MTDKLDDLLRRIKTPEEIAAQNPGTVPLTPSRDPTRPIPPLPEVPVSRPPFGSPFKNVREYIAALEDENERLKLEIDNRTMRETGRVPWSLRIGDLVRGAIASGVIAVAMKLIGWL